MSSTFLTLRYVAFALIILFNSVICILAALNLGALQPNTPQFPEVDSYLIFLGALGVVFVFPVIFVELFRKNAFISRVAVEIVWISLFWVMSLSGAAAMTAISPQLHCGLTGSQLDQTCRSANALLAFTWLSTLTLLSYLFGLVISALIHSQDNANVWGTGVRDFQWFTQRQTPRNTPEVDFTYGKLADPREPSYLPPVYGQPFGGGYQVEPLKIEQMAQRPVDVPPTQPPADHLRNFKFPVRPTPAALRIDTQAGDPYRTVPHPAPPPAEPPTSIPQPSLYPQFVQASGGHIVQPPKPNGPTPPPAGSWPRSKPQEPLRKSRPSPSAPSAYPQPALPVGPSSATSPNPRPLPSITSRPRPSGPRHASLDRSHRPPPLDLSLTNSHRQ